MQGWETIPHLGISMRTIWLNKLLQQSLQMEGIKKTKGNAGKL